MSVSIRKFIHKTLSDIENEIISKQAYGLRILINVDGLSLLNAEWTEFNEQNLPVDLRDFSIVCICETNDNIINEENPIIHFKALTPQKLNEEELITYIEKKHEILWSKKSTNEPIFIMFSTPEFKAFQERAHSKITLLPFPIDTKNTQLPNQLQILHRTTEYDNEKQDGTNCLRTIARVFSGKFINSGSEFGPMIRYFGYSNEKKFVDESPFYKPQNFNQIYNKLINTDKPLLLTGFGLGTDFVGIKLLQKISNSVTNNKIFEIRVYSKDTLIDFINDFQMENLYGTSVILRDVFDPYGQLYNGHGTHDFTNSEYAHLLEKKENTKDSENYSLKKDIVVKSIKLNKSFEILFHQNGDIYNRMLKFFDGKNGNFLIITSQFDLKPKMISFYENYLEQDEAYFRKIIDTVSPLYNEGLTYHSKVSDKFFAKLKDDIEELTENDCENIQEGLRKAYDRFTKHKQIFRIAFATLFKYYVFEELGKLLVEQAASDMMMEIMLERLEERVAKISDIPEKYFNFLKNDSKAPSR